MPANTLSSQIRALLKEMQAGSPTIAATGIPGFVTARTGQQVVFSSKAETLIASLARQLRVPHPSLSRSHTDAEWTAAIRQAFGDSYANLPNPTNKAKSASQIANELTLAASAIASLQTNRHLGFGAALTAKVHFDSLSIGPVCFERRELWLKRSLASGAVSGTTARRVAKQWQGTKCRRRKGSYDAISERGILDAVGKHPLICTVDVAGLGAELGKRKGIIAAQVAQLAVSLMWAAPSSALRGFHLLSSSGPERERILVTVRPHKPTASSSLIKWPSGPNLTKEQWDNQLPTYRPLFDLVGEAVAYFLQPVPSTSRPKLMNILVQALFSFFDACASDFDQMAIARFVSVLDGLAGGTQEQGIRQLLVKRGRLKEDRPIFKDGALMKDFIHQVYSDARSRTFHGTSDKFGNDWTEMRNKIEQVSRLALLQCMFWMIDNPALDTPSAMRS